MDSWEPVESSAIAYKLLLKAVTMIPKSHYMLGCLCILIVVFYNFLEFHFIGDLFTGFRGSQVGLTYNPCSNIYQGVVNKCRILHGRYLATPWLSSPHFQTTFLCFLARPPVVNYARQLFHASDGGTIALDWLMSSDVLGDAYNAISKDDTTPIVVVIPGLTSDSADAYIKHLASNMAKHGWNVVVSNHRGLGGISVTSDCFYNAGWTEDIREIVEYLHREYPKAPLFAIGTSIGANVLVKYLGEDGDNVPVAGAAAICSPWDLLIGDRFIGRRLIQKLYDRALAIGLQDYAKLHEPRYSRLADWEGIKKSRSIRDFDNYATCLVGKFETVDMYYRRCSSSSYVQNVSVPLLCISALDDPLCTVEAIPWDECRANKNIVLATTKHGGHLALFEGVAASSLWWVRATKEFLSVLHASPFMHKRKKTQSPELNSSVESSIDEGSYISVADGMVAAVGNELATKDKDEVQDSSQEQVQQQQQQIHDFSTNEQAAIPNLEDFKPPDLASQLKRGLHQLSRQNRSLMWLLAYISIISTWPFLGKVLHFFFHKKPRNIKPSK